MFGRNKTDTEDKADTAKTTYLISVKPPATHRCRAGRCFEGKDTSVQSPTEEQLQAWEEDEFLLVKKA